MISNIWNFCLNHQKIVSQLLWRKVSLDLKKKTSYLDSKIVFFLVEKVELKNYKCTPYQQFFLAMLRNLPRSLNSLVSSFRIEEIQSNFLVRIKPKLDQHSSIDATESVNVVHTLETQISENSNETFILDFFRTVTNVNETY